MFVIPKGVMQSPVTPMHSDGAIDYEALEQLLDFYISQGTTALCVPLHIGESPNLTIEERQRLVAECVRLTAGRVPVLANVSMSGTDDAITLARAAEAAGATGVFVLPPYYWKLGEDELFNHFVAIGTAIDIAMLAYNSPTLQGTWIAPRLLRRLIERLENFVGLKEASHNWEYFIEAKRETAAVRPDFGLLVGVEYLLPSMVIGGSGSLSALGGIAPSLIANLYHACAEEDYAAARPLQAKASQLWTFFKEEYPSRIKAAMEIMGRPVGPARLPNRQFGAGETEWIRTELEKLGILDEEPHGWDALPSRVSTTAV